MHRAHDYAAHSRDSGLSDEACALLGINVIAGQDTDVDLRPARETNATRHVDRSRASSASLTEPDDSRGRSADRTLTHTAR
jgi:hypothetical protein